METDLLGGIGIGIIAIGGRWYGSIRHLPPLRTILLLYFLHVFVLVRPLPLTIQSVATASARAHNVRLEETGDLSYVHTLQFLPIQRSVQREVQIKEILGTVILIHTDILQLEFDLDIIVGEKGGELDELIPKILNELVIDIGDPSLQLDGDILE